MLVITNLNAVITNLSFQEDILQLLQLCSRQSGGRDGQVGVRGDVRHADVAPLPGCCLHAGGPRGAGRGLGEAHVSVLAPEPSTVGRTGARKGPQKVGAHSAIKTWTFGRRSSITADQYAVFVMGA